MSPGPRAPSTRISAVVSDVDGTLLNPVDRVSARTKAVVGRLAESANVSVLGEVTNLAARLQGQAKGHEILLSEEAHRRLKDRLVAGSESLALKGFDRPVTAYRVLAPRARLISGNSRS